MANRRPPIWKLKREAGRMLSQAGGSFGHLVEYATATPYHDFVLAKSIIVTDGFVSECNRIAIYVIFPERGVLESHLMALRWLQDNGMSPLIVSNLVLKASDLERLQAHSWKVIQRSNFGYDFGAYRQAVLFLESRLPKMEQLVLLNDSCWFPLPGAQNWLDQVSELGVAFSSGAAHYAVKATDADRFLEQNWCFVPNGRSFHYTSYAISVDQRILRDPDFLAFWRSYRLSNVKNRTVRRGEIGLSQWVVSRGYTHDCTLPLARLLDDLVRLPTDRLRHYAEKTISINNKELVEIKAKFLYDGANICKQELIQFLVHAAARQGISFALPALTIAEYQYGFLKKSPIRLSSEARQITIEIISELEGPSAEVIRREAVELANENVQIET